MALPHLFMKHPTQVQTLTPDLDSIPGANMSRDLISLFKIVSSSNCNFMNRGAFSLGKISSASGIMQIAIKCTSYQSYQVFA